MSHMFLRAYVIKPPSCITKIRGKQNKSNKDMSINTPEMTNVAKRNQLFSHCWIIWQYGLWSFPTEGTKLGRVLPKNQYTQSKLLNFENWVNGEVSKSTKI